MEANKRRVYLDHAATTYVKPQVLEAMTPYFTEYFGNCLPATTPMATKRHCRHGKGPRAGPQGHQCPAAAGDLLYRRRL